MTGPPVDAAVEAGRAGQALELRKAGVPYTLIATQLGFPGADEVRAVVVPLLAEAVADAVRESAALERLRIDGMLTGLYTKARAGDTRAVEQSLRLMERKRLLEAMGAEDEQAGGGSEA